MSGHAAPAPTRPRNSRRLMLAPKLRHDHRSGCEQCLEEALCPKRVISGASTLSAPCPHDPLQADVRISLRHVALGPEADIRLSYQCRRVFRADTFWCENPTVPP